MKRNILITGGSGLIGRRLTAMLLEAGHHVAHLSRGREQTQVPTFFWDIGKKTIDAKAFDKIDVIIHLAGAGIGDKRWSEKRKQEIMHSRVATADMLYKAASEAQHMPRTFISASGIAFYGLHDKDGPYTEEDEQGDGFLADVVRAWEQAADNFSALDMRVVKIRTGLVLSREGGALKTMMQPVRFYVGSPLGSGKQPMSWIHLDDLCHVYIKAVEDEGMQGVYNGVAPGVVSNKTFMAEVAKALKKPMLLPAVPEFALRILLGEMADLVVKGTTVLPQRLTTSGFQFRYTSLTSALADIFPKK